VDLRLVLSGKKAISECDVMDYGLFQNILVLNIRHFQKEKYVARKTRGEEVGYLYSLGSVRVVFWEFLTS